MPNLSCLARPRPLAIPPFQGRPTEVCELPDQSLIVADWDGGPAWRVWPDGSQPPQQLPPATANATAVLPVADGYLVVSYDEGRVERTGSIAWKRTDLQGPWAAVVVGDTALVTENCGGAGQVVRLALGSGATVGTVGKGILENPSGIAVGPTTGEIVVADWGPNLVHVSGLVCVCVWFLFFVSHVLLEEKRMLCIHFFLPPSLPPLLHCPCSHTVGRCLTAGRLPSCAPSAREC